MRRNAIGQWGEELACRHLRALGWRILERNWRCSEGELDIVATEPGRLETLVFCEVKCRTSTNFGVPLEAITQVKFRRLRVLAARWLAEHEWHGSQVRIDGIGVLVPPAGGPRIDHIRGIG